MLSFFPIFPNTSCLLPAPLIGKTTQEGQFEWQIHEFEGKWDAKPVQEFIKS